MKQKPTSRRRRGSKSLLRLPDRECGRTSDAHAPKRYPPDYSRMTDITGQSLPILRVSRV